MTNPKVIWTADPGERIVAATQHRDRLFITTEQRVLEWLPELEAIQVVEFLVHRPSSAPDSVLQVER